jgi:hypothetical protein
MESIWSLTFEVNARVQLGKGHGTTPLIMKVFS